MNMRQCVRFGEAWRLWAFLLVVAGTPMVRAQVTQAEVAALAQFRSGITDDPTNALASWSGEQPCLFAGIACGPIGAGPNGVGAVQDVVQIDLSNLNLTGTISPALGQITRLQNLTLRGNHFFGPIPTGLHNMTSLVLIDVSYNNLSGTVPVGLLSMPIIKLILDNNPNLCDPRSPTAACDATPNLGPTPVPRSDDGGDGFSAGAIIGILVAILLLGGVIGGGVFYWFKVHKKKRRASLNFERFTGMGVSEGEQY